MFEAAGFGVAVAPVAALPSGPVPGELDPAPLGVVNRPGSGGGSQPAKGWSCGSTTEVSRRAAVLDRPLPVDRYTPTPAQRRFLTGRDRTCRHPGCTRRCEGTDADHVTAYAAGGPTACENLSNR